MYTPLLERLLVVQIDSYPQYSERMQGACCKSILKVLVATASKGPVLWSFISSVGTLVVTYQRRVIILNLVITRCKHNIC